MKGIVITTKYEMRVQEFSEPAYESIGEAVSGWIEIVHPVRLKRPYCMVVNEEGAASQPPNECPRQLPLQDGHSWKSDCRGHRAAQRGHQQRW